MTTEELEAVFLLNLYRSYSRASEVSSIPISTLSQRVTSIEKELGAPIFNGDVLNEEIGVEEIRKYVYFTETKRPIEPYKLDEPYYMGTQMDLAYYFYYEKDSITSLNRDFLHTVKTKAEGYVIYANLCTLSTSELEKWHITFKKIPRDISRL